MAKSDKKDFGSIDLNLEIIILINRGNKTRLYQSERQLYK